MKLFYEHVVIFFNLSPTSNYLHPQQVESCDSNSRLVVDEDDNGKFRLERVKYSISYLCQIITINTGKIGINYENKLERYLVSSQLKIVIFIND